jgi:hypothetical protein
MGNEEKDQFFEDIHNTSFKEPQQAVADNLPLTEVEEFEDIWDKIVIACNQ